MSSQNGSAGRSAWHSIERWLWRWSTAWETLAVLLGLLALALILGRVFPQVPSYMRSDLGSLGEWLSAVQVRFKGWTTFLDAAGAFHINDTLWFRAVLALSAFVLLISLGEQARSWHSDPLPRRGETSFDLPSDDAVARVREAMQALVGHVHQEKTAEQIRLCAYRFPLTTLAPTAVYVGLLCLLCGLAVDARWGWEQADVQLLPGAGVSLGPTREHQLELVETQPPLLPPTVAIVRADGRQVYVHAGRPAQLGAYRYRLQGAGGPFLRVGARRKDGEPLTLYNYAVRPEPTDELAFTFVPDAPPEEADRLFIVAPDNLVVRVRWSNPTATDEPPHFHLWVFSGQEPAGDAQVTPTEEEATVTVGNVEYVFNVSRYVILDVVHWPGWWLLAGGCTLTTLGLLGAALHREAWAVVTVGKERATVRLMDRPGIIGRQGQLVQALRARIEERQ